MLDQGRSRGPGVVRFLSGRVFDEVRNFKGVVKCFGADPLCRFLETLEFAERVELAQSDL